MRHRGSTRDLQVKVRRQAVQFRRPSIYHWKESFWPDGHWIRVAVVRLDGMCRVDSWAHFLGRIVQVTLTVLSAVPLVPEQNGIFLNEPVHRSRIFTSFKGISRTSRIIWWMSCKLCWTSSGTGLQQARTPWGSLKKWWSSDRSGKAPFLTSGESRRFAAAYDWVERI
jgi:hypothetical protein